MSGGGSDITVSGSPGTKRYAPLLIWEELERGGGWRQMSVENDC